MKLAKRILALVLIVACLSGYLAVCVEAADNGKYFPRYTGSSSSITTALNSIGVNSSYSYRCKIAAANGISNYSGTAAQNTKMLSLLKSGQLINPDAKAEQSPNPPENKYFPRYSGSSGSITVALNAVGADSSYAFRKKIAAVNGIANYSGTASQNTQMLSLLKNGKLINPNATSDSDNGNNNTSSGMVDVTAEFAGKTVTIRSVENGLYLCADANISGTPAMFNRSAASTWETFTFTQTAPDGWVAIKAKTNGKYLMANKSDANAPLLACSDNWLSWECFKVYKQNGNYYIKAQATNKWLCVRVDRNGAPVWAMADVPSTWERLDIKVVSTNKNNDIILNVKPVFQSTSNTCSGAAALAVLQYNGKATNKTDKDIYGSVQGIVANSVSTLNSYLGAGTYKWSTCGTLENYEKTIRASLSQNAPVIVRVKFPKGYFNYGSSGHHTTIIGIYTDDSGKVWLKIADSYVNRYNGNNYCNKDTGIVHVPLDVMFDYGDYGNTSPVYVIHHK